MGNECIQLRVMSFNVRFPCETDTGNLWSERREIAFDMIRRYQPDVIGMQEVYRSQMLDFAAALQDFSVAGRERYGGTEEEHNPLFFRRQRFLLEESGTRWFSETPDEPGTRTICPEDHPRIVTRASLLDIETAFRVCILNTHFPLTRDESRQIACAQVIGAQVPRVGPEGVAILMGDFNAPPTGGLHQFLTGPDVAPGIGFRDVREIAAEVVGPEGTVHGFRGGTPPEPRRIDWILAAGEVAVKRFETVLFQHDGKNPSDHYPVCADLELRYRTP